MRERIPLPEAARRLKWSYFKTYNAVLTGQMRAEQDARGHWMVVASDVERAAAQGATTTGK